MPNYTILLIDYEPRSIERFRDPLVAAGYTVEIATDGISGIEAFHRLNPDMVLVEAMIPKKHGFEVCQELKRTPHGRRTPVLITTGVYKGRKYRTQALHIYGCDEYIEKPIAPEQLLEVVGRFFIAEESEGSAPSARAAEPASAGSDIGRMPSVHAHGHESTDAQASPSAETQPRKPPKSTPTARARTNDDEAEIMARLDAIMPTGTASPAAEQAPVMVATTFEPIPSSPAIGDDPLAQIRDELNAELGSFSAAVAAEPAPAEEPMLEPIPSDHPAPPSVLEALPAPAVEAEQPGQIVTFDTKRSRKGGKNKKASRASSAQSAAPAVSDAALFTPTDAMPQRARVEAPPAPAASRRRMPTWAWATAMVVASLGLYFFFTSSSSTGDAKRTATAPATAQRVAEPRTIAPTARATVAAPKETLGTAEGRKPVAASVAKTSPPPSAKKTVESAKASAPASAPTSEPASALVTTSVTAPAPVAAAPAAPEQEAPTAAAAAPAKPQPAAQPPSSVDDNAVGVEKIPETTDAAAPAAAIAPGALVPIDEADSLPVSISRPPPVYPMQAKQLHVSGTVIMNVLVNERGTVDQVVLVTGAPANDVNEAAMHAAKSWTYRPATKHGIPVKVWKSESVVFKL